MVKFTFSTQEKPGALFAISMPFHPSPLPTASSLSPDTAQCLRGGDASQWGARPSRHVPHTGHCRCSDQGRPHGISLHIPVDQGVEGVAFRSHMQIGALSLTAQGQERNHHSHTKPWRLGPGEGLPELGGLQASVSAEGERPPPEGQRGERGAGKRPEAPRTRFTEPHVPCSRGGKRGPLGSRVPGNGLSGKGFLRGDASAWQQLPRSRRGSCRIQDVQQVQQGQRRATVQTGSQEPTRASRTQGKHLICCTVARPPSRSLYKEIPRTPLQRPS